MSVPAVDHDGGAVLSVASDSFDKLDEGATGLGDAMLRPRCVVEVANQKVMTMLLGAGRHSSVQVPMMPDANIFSTFTS